jgi:hypothetical protein
MSDNGKDVPVEPLSAREKRPAFQPNDPVLEKALAHTDLATSYLAIALKEFSTAAWRWETDKDLEYVAQRTKEVLEQLVPALDRLVERGIHHVPEASLKVLRKYDPKTYDELSLILAAGGRS